MCGTHSKAKTRAACSTASRQRSTLLPILMPLVSICILFASPSVLSYLLRPQPNGTRRIKIEVKLLRHILDNFLGLHAVSRRVQWRSEDRDSGLDGHDRDDAAADPALRRER